jgi:hypothetical protein
MSQPKPTSDFLVLSRGQWDESKTPAQIQAAIDDFYVWYEGLLATGQAKPGQRLAREGKVVTRSGILDGPFAEAKEVVGGYWVIVAADLAEAATIAAGNPCLACGLQTEVRPVDPERASATSLASETPKSLAPAVRQPQPDAR